MFFSKAIAGMAGTTLLAGALIFHQGVITVNVQEKRPDGDHVHFFVPATVVSYGMALAPEEQIRHATRHAREYLPAARIAMQELAKCPDTVLVEVQDNDEHVRIEKRGGRLLVDVNSPKEEVHVGVPIQTVVSVIKDVEAAAARDKADRADWD
jgi:hypothetical protein